MGIRGRWGLWLCCSGDPHANYLFSRPPFSCAGRSLIALGGLTTRLLGTRGRGRASRQVSSPHWPLVVGPGASTWLLAACVLLTHSESCVDSEPGTGY